METTIYRADREVFEVAARFENCEYAAAEFTHARHMTVACWYLCMMSPEAALARMRAGLQHFLVRHGQHGYHETITRFWIELLGEYLRNLPEEIRTVDKVNRALRAHADKDCIFRYYSREVVMSDVARKTWILPDVDSSMFRSGNSKSQKG